MQNMSKKYILFITVGILFVIVLIPTSYKILKNYHKKSYLVVEKKIIEATKKCYNENKCSGDKITLKDLYDNKYLDTMVDPITKKIYDENLEIKKGENDFIVRVH